jgi:hypothetical protein
MVSQSFFSLLLPSRARHQTTSLPRLLVSTAPAPSMTGDAGTRLVATTALQQHVFDKMAALQSIEKKGTEAHAHVRAIALSPRRRTCFCRRPRSLDRSDYPTTSADHYLPQCTIAPTL